jgi:antitoxin VapB
MNAIIKTSAFKTGNSVAVRLPKSFGIKAGDALEVKRRGRDVEIHVLADPDYERAQIAELIRELDAIGPVPGAELARDDGRIEFPDRPGLY